MTAPPSTNERPLSGRLALVTGGGQRLGRAISETLASAGAEIVVHYNRSAAEAEQLAAGLRESGVSAWTLAADLSDAAAAEGLVSRAAELAGRPLTVLVNNASAYGEVRLRDLTYDKLDEAMRTSAWAPFVATRAFAAQTESGVVINMLDTRTVDYDWQHTAYILAKKTLTELTRMAAVEYAPRIRVNGVAPGAILPPEGADADYVARISRTMPLRRFGAAQDIADAVLYLVMAEYVTGQVIYVDGGRHLGRTLS